MVLPLAKNMLSLLMILICQKSKFLLIQLILSISKTTGTILNKEFASTSSASWEYAGRFCFRPNNYPEYSAESNLLISIPPGAGDVELEGGCEVDETEEASMEETEPALLDQARGCVGMVLEMPLFCCICCCC